MHIYITYTWPRTRTHSLSLFLLLCAWTTISGSGTNCMQVYFIMIVGVCACACGSVMHCYVLLCQHMRMSHVRDDVRAPVDNNHSHRLEAFYYLNVHTCYKNTVWKVHVKIEDINFPFASNTYVWSMMQYRKSQLYNSENVPLKR